MLASCRPQPNWIPRNPKLMFEICQKLRRGLFISALSISFYADSALPCINIDVFQHHLAVERQHIHQRARHVCDVNKTGFWLCLRSSVLDIDQTGTKVEDANVRICVANL